VRESTVYGRYEQPIDRESAYEKLRARAQAAQPPAPAPAGRPGARGQRGVLRDPGEKTMDMIESVAKSAARAAGTQLGREIMRGVLGSLFGGRRR